MLKDKQTAKSAPPVFTMHKENFTKITSVKSNEKSSVSYADTLKSSGARENSVGFETCFQTLTKNLTTFTQNNYDKYYGIHAKHNARTVEVIKPNAASPPF